MRSDDSPGIICHYCGGNMTEGERIHLWDGNTYCKRCVESVCPGLSEHARDHAFLVEEFPMRAATLAWRLLIPMGLVYALCLINPHKESLESFGWTGYVIESTVMVGLFYGMFLFSYLALRQLCSVVGGTFIFHWWAWKREPVEFQRLLNRNPHSRKWFARKSRHMDPAARNTYLWKWSEAICWRESTAIGASHAQWSNVLLGLPAIRRQVIIIEFPPPKWLGLELPFRRIAVGWTPEMRERWRALLVLGRVPENRKKAQRTDD